MRFAEVAPLFEYWGRYPPEHESVAFLAVAKGWRPVQREATDLDIAGEIERARASGRYLRLDRLAGIPRVKPGDVVPGLGPLPWPEMQKVKDNGK